MWLSDLREQGLEVDEFCLVPGQVWCLLGGNGSGKSRLAAMMAGELQTELAHWEGRPQRVGLLSFEVQQRLYEQELARDESDFMDAMDHGSTGLELALQSGRTEHELQDLARALGFLDLLSKHYRSMSSGEARKILLLCAWAKEPELLILDEPFEGLDPESRASLAAACELLARQNVSLMFVLSRIEDVTDWVTHVAFMRGGCLLQQGPREEVLAKPEVQQLVHFAAGDPITLPSRPAGQPTSNANPLLLMNQCVVRYGDLQPFEPLDWELRRGHHTLIMGPNGAGKSTLLQLISGDHPQCYANDMEIFGYQRGSGESIWDIKKHIGMVSPALHRDYRAPGHALSVVLSGLYDSIGVYTAPQPSEIALARQWLGVLGMAGLERRGFRELSHGQQRLLLIARGLIKQPDLLLLDEPTQGLDSLNRHLVLSFLERLAALLDTTLLFVSHREDEHIPLFRHVLRFSRGTTGGARFRVSHELRD